MDTLLLIPLWWCLGLVGTVVLFITVETLFWLFRSKEWNMNVMKGIRSWKSEGKSSPWALVKLWPILLMLLLFALIGGRSLIEMLLNMDGHDLSPQPANPRRDHWLDQTQGPLERRWADGAHDGVRVYAARFRVGVVTTHVLVKPPSEDEWGAFRLDPATFSPNTHQPFAVGPDSTVLQLVCERDAQWLSECTPLMEV